MRDGRRQNNRSLESLDVLQEAFILGHGSFSLTSGFPGKRTVVIMLGKSLGPYRIVEKLGEGGMGEVYRATDSRLHRDVALKILPEGLADDPGRMARFEHEARVLASLNHPNIAAIYGLETADGGYALVMELVEGTTLAQQLEEGPLKLDTLLPIAQQLCAALIAAHESGIIHRDLKPSNIKISPHGQVKILDFGIAQASQPTREESSTGDNTMDMAVEVPAMAGTVRYMAPEQLRGESCDARTDIYAFGVVLYEMAVGRHPHGDSHGMRLVGEIQHAPPMPPRWLNPRLPLRLEELVLKCLEKEPNLRFGSMRAVADALRRIGEDGRESEKTLAVLYFENSSGDQSDEYFCDGITEDIIVELSRIHELSVLSRSAVLGLRKKSLSPIEAGRQIGAAYVLNGGVRRLGNRLRITTELVETRSGRSLWAERYDRQLEDVFAIQDEIAANIARTLRVVVSEAEKRAIAKAPTAKVEAYEYYLQGQQHFRQFRRKSIEFAIQLFTKAIETDPEYARAHAALADCYSYLYMFWEASEANLQAAEKASHRAVELDPELAEAYVARGVVISLGKDYDRADKEFQIAIRLNPKLFEAYYFYARGYYARGKLEEATYWFERASQARPEDYQSPTLMASALAGLGRKADSNAAFRLTLERAQKHLELNPGDARALYFSAIALCQLGEDEERSAELAERALAMDPDEPQVLYNVGCVYALLGHLDKALACLELTIAHGGWWKTWMRNDPDLSSLHDDPRFVDLVRE